MLVPPSCWSCGAVARRGQPLCRSCRGRLHRLGPEPVRLRGLPVWAPVAYSGPARDLVRALKFSGATRTADAMAAQMVAGAPPGWLDGRAPVAGVPLAGVPLAGGPVAGAPVAGVPVAGVPLAGGPVAGATVLVPVPLHPRRLRRRGYNQAALVAVALGGRTGLPVADCLVRSGPGATQVGRDRRERQAGPAGRIAVRDPRAGAPRAEGGLAAARVLLVDDVATTGATLSACAAALRSAGAEVLAGLAFARTIGR